MNDHHHLPSPTIWPIVAGAGISLIAFGLLTHWVFALLGLVATVRAIVGWIAELRHE